MASFYLPFAAPLATVIVIIIMDDCSFGILQDAPFLMIMICSAKC
jgi:hypothetical protein